MILVSDRFVAPTAMKNETTHLSLGSSLLSLDLICSFALFDFVL